MALEPETHLPSAFPPTDGPHNLPGRFPLHSELSPPQRVVSPARQPTTPKQAATNTPSQPAPERLPALPSDWHPLCQKFDDVLQMVRPHPFWLRFPSCLQHMRPVLLQDVIFAHSEESDMAGGKQPLLRTDISNGTLIHVFIWPGLFCLTSSTAHNRSTACSGSQIHSWLVGPFVLFVLSFRIR